MRARERGHTLIEVMIAAFVFTVGALGLLRLLLSGAEGTTVSEKITYATVLAREKLDELTRLPYDSIDSGQEATNIDGKGNAKGALDSSQASDGWFSRSWTVTEPDASFSYKQIQVDVKWADKTLKRERGVRITGGKSQQ